jgi:ABC-2 type transport system ATP-binding protein
MDIKNAVEIKKLTVVLGKDFVALDNINVNLKKGKIIGFIGPSGAGKTTLIRSIVGRQKILNGEIKVFNLPAGSSELRKNVSYMTQENSVYKDITVEQNIKYFARMYGVKKANLTAEVNKILRSTDMTNQAKNLVNNISGGQKQRVSLAVALIGSPKLMVLDEPTVGLDPALRDQIWSQFNDLARKGTTLIVTSHVMDEASRCDELLLLRDGKVLDHDSPKNICQKTNSVTVEESFLKLVRSKN